MEVSAKEVRDYLIDDDKLLFDKIESHEILGATQHIKIIGNMLLNSTNNSFEKGDSAETLQKVIESISTFYIQTRGVASKAITNSILLMIKGIKENDDSPEHIVEAIRANIKAYGVDSKKNSEKAINIASEELREYKKIFLYDYSSTVEKSIIALAKNVEKIHIYIAESSSINGGNPYLSLLKQKNITIDFFPDSAIYHKLKECDVCLMGAETFYADGTGFNTIGSDMVGVLCNRLNIPLYFITPMIKLDIDRMFGLRKKLVYLDLKKRLVNVDKEIDTSRINCVIPELIGVDPGDIYAFITESGVIPSNQLFGMSLEYNYYLKGDN